MAALCSSGIETKGGVISGGKGPQLPTLIVNATPVVIRARAESLQEINELTWRLMKNGEFAMAHVTTKIQRCTVDGSEPVPDHIVTYMFGFGFALDDRRLAILSNVVSRIEDSQVLRETMKLGAHYDGKRNSTLLPKPSPSSLVNS